MTIKVYNILNKNFKKAKELSLFLDCDLVSKKPSVDSYIEVSEEGLIFVSNTNKTKKYLHIDFTKGSMAWRLSRSEHETLLKKALGRNKDQIKIFDATAGLLQDSLVFLSLGTFLLFAIIYLLFSWLWYVQKKMMSLFLWH